MNRIYSSQTKKQFTTGIKLKDKNQIKEQDKFRFQHSKTQLSQSKSQSNFTQRLDSHSSQLFPIFKNQINQNKSDDEERVYIPGYESSNNIHPFRMSSQIIKQDNTFQRPLSRQKQRPHNKIQFNDYQTTSDLNNHDDIKDINQQIKQLKSIKRLNDNQQRSMSRHDSENQDSLYLDATIKTSSNQSPKIQTKPQRAINNVETNVDLQRVQTNKNKIPIKQKKEQKNLMEKLDQNIEKQMLKANISNLKKQNDENRTQIQKQQTKHEEQLNDILKQKDEIIMDRTKKQQKYLQKMLSQEVRYIVKSNDKKDQSKTNNINKNKIIESENSSKQEKRIYFDTVSYDSESDDIPVIQQQSFVNPNKYNFQGRLDNYIDMYSHENHIMFREDDNLNQLQPEFLNQTKLEQRFSNFKLNCDKSYETNEWNIGQKYKQRIFEADEQLFKNNFSEIQLNSNQLKLYKCLNEIHRQAQRIDQGKPIKLYPIETLPQHKIVETNHINFKQIIDPNIDEKIDQNQSLLVEDYKLKQKLNGISFFRINDYIKMKPNELIFMDADTFKRRDQKVQLRRANKTFSMNIRHTVFMRMQLQQEKMAQMMMEQAKNYFISIDDYSFIDRLGKKCYSMFDLVQRVNKNPGIYYQIDWSSIQNQADRLERLTQIRKQEIVDYENKLLDIEKVLNKYIPIPQLSFNNTKVQFNICNLEKKNEGQIRNCEIIFKQKLTFLSKRYQRFLNRYPLANRYYHDVQYFDFNRRDLSKFYRKKFSAEQQEALKIPIGFYDTETYLMCYERNANSLNNTIFAKDIKSIFHNLKDQHWDLKAFEIMRNLKLYWNKVNNQKRAQQQESKQRIRTLIQTKFKYKMIKRSQSCSSILHKIQSINYQKVNQQLLDEQSQKNETQSLNHINSNQMVDYYRPIRKQNALTKYTARFLEKEVSKRLQPMAYKVEDNNLMVYKDYQKYTQDWNFEYNRDGGANIHFGFKCSFIRDPKENTRYMEIFVPVLKKKVNRKLLTYTNRNNQVFEKIQKGIKNYFIQSINREEENIQKQFKPLNPQVSVAIKAQDIDTDEEMKNIQAEDLFIGEDQSDSDEEMNEKNVSQGYKDYMNVLNTVNNPLDYYSNLPKKRKFDEKTIRDDFDPSSPVFSSEFFESKQIRIVDDEELKELNQQNARYQSKNERFKIDQVITKNYKEVEYDFIDQIEQMKVKDSILQMKNPKKLAQAEILKVYKKQSQSQLKQVIQKLKYNLGLISHQTQSIDQINSQKFDSLHEQDSFDIELEKLNDEDKLVVEREVLMSIFGKFINYEDESELFSDKSQDFTALNSQSENTHQFQIPFQDDSQNVDQHEEKSQQSNNVNFVHLKQLQNYLNSEDVDIDNLSIEENFEFGCKFDNDQLSEDSNDNLKTKKINDQPGLESKKRKQLNNLILEAQKSQHQKKISSITNFHIFDDFIARNNFVRNYIKKTAQVINITWIFEEYEKTIQTKERINMLLMQVQKEKEKENEITKKKLFKYVHQKNIQGVLEQIKRYPKTNRKMVDSNGNSLVGIATCKGDFKMVKVLTSNHFDINIPNKDGNTPLHMGICLRNIKIIEFLLYCNVIENVRNRKGLTPWQLV